MKKKILAKYLKKNAESDDVVLITYGDLPLKFYTELKVIGGRSGEDVSPAKMADWIILRKYWPAWRVDNLIPHLPRRNYERIVINYPDTQWENRESLAWHHFRTVDNEDRVVMYHRIK